MGCISRTRCISPVPARSSLTGRYVGNWHEAAKIDVCPNVGYWG
jgi:hypothetical protein